MHAIVYHGPGEKNWESAPDPGIGEDTDAIVKVDTVTICGTDLHILKGDVTAVTDGRILGHEATGTVQEVGSGVKNFKAGDRVLVSCISTCSSETPSGMWYSDVSANGVRRYSACVPSIKWPRIQPPPPTHAPYRPSRQ